MELPRPSDSLRPVGDSQHETPPPDGSSSVTEWLDRLVEAGESQATEKLWRRYFDQLTQLARNRLRSAPRREADEEDVALSAFELFCRRAAEDRFPRLADRDDLWRLLVTITEHKARDLVRRQRTQKRGGGRVRGHSALDHVGETPANFGDHLPSPDPTPEFAAMAAEECRRLLDALGDETLRNLALGKLAGKTNEELAAEGHCSLAKIERKLRVIRTIWGKGGAGARG